MDIHATSRGRPGLRDSNLNLSLSQGFIYERNTAKRFMEDVRKVCSVLTVRAPLPWVTDAFAHAWTVWPNATCASCACFGGMPVAGSNGFPADALCTG